MLRLSTIVLVEPIVIVSYSARTAANLHDGSQSFTFMPDAFKAAFLGGI